MKFKWIVIAVTGLIAGLAVIAADPALARSKAAKNRCVNPPIRAYTFNDFIFGRPAPQPNGCAPAVYSNNRYVGQDPDPFIRHELLRDPRTGYSAY